MSRRGSPTVHGGGLASAAVGSVGSATPGAVSDWKPRVTAIPRKKQARPTPTSAAIPRPLNGRSLHRELGLDRPESVPELARDVDRPGALGRARTDLPLPRHVAG